MTVNSLTITSGPYVGNGTADEFSYTFGIEDKSQVLVYETDDEGTQTLLTVDTDYTVNDVGEDVGGTILRLDGALPTDYEWYIRSNFVATQDTAFSSQGAFFPELHEDAMDKMTRLIQQIDDRNDRSLRFPDSYALGETGAILPEPEAGKIMRWRDDLLGVENFDISEIDPGAVVITDYIRRVSTFAALGNLDGTAGLRAETNGFTVAGIGANEYQCYAGSASIAGIHIDSNTPGFYWALVRKGNLRDVDVGSLPDNSTDNFAALNLGFTVLVSLGGMSNGILELSSGTTRTSGQISIPRGCKLKGTGCGGNWASGNGVAHGTSPSYSSRLLYTGSASVNVVLLADGEFDNGLEDLYIDGGRTVPQIQAWADAFNAPTTLPTTVIGIRSTSTLGARVRNVRVQNVTYGMLMDSVSTHSNAHGEFVNLVIQTCNIGILAAGIFDQAPISNHTFIGLKTIGYYNRGVDLRVAADTNVFINTYVSTSIVPSVGWFENSSSPGINQGVGWNNSFNLVMDLFNPAPGDNGMRSIVGGYTYPGVSYLTTFISPVTNNHYTLVTPERYAGSGIRVSNAVAESFTVNEIGLWNGGALTTTLSATFVTAAGVTAFFNANAWSSRYDTAAAVSRFRLSTKIDRIEWVTRWNPGSSSGSIQLYDSVGAVVVGTDITPGAAGSITSVQDVTDLFLSLARGVPNYTTPNDVLITMRQKGDNITAPIIYRSLLRVVTTDSCG